MGRKTNYPQFVMYNNIKLEALFKFASSETMETASDAFY